MKLTRDIIVLINGEEVLHKEGTPAEEMKKVLKPETYARYLKNGYIDNVDAPANTEDKKKKKKE